MNVSPNGFVNNADNTTTDTETGLMWTQIRSDFNWENTLSYCENLVFGGYGYNDWRLPNTNELITIANYGISNPVIDTDYFHISNCERYWSSNTSINNLTEAVILQTEDGEVGPGGSDKDFNENCTICVRGPILEFTTPIANAGADQTVFDEITLDGSQSSTPTGSIISYDWQIIHRGNPDNNRVAQGGNPTLTSLVNGIYDVILVIETDTGAIDSDNMIFTATGLKGDFDFDGDCDGDDLAIFAASYGTYVGP